MQCVLCVCARACAPLAVPRGFDGWCVTSVWSQPFGGNPLGLEDALVLSYFTAYLFTPLFHAVPYDRRHRLMVIDWQFDFETIRPLLSTRPNAPWHSDILSVIHSLGCNIYCSCKVKGNTVLMMICFHKSAQFHLTETDARVTIEQVGPWNKLQEKENQVHCAFSCVEGIHSEILHT